MGKKVWKFSPEKIRGMTLDDLILIEDLQSGETRFRDFKKLLGRIMVSKKQVDQVSIGNLQEVADALGDAVAEALGPPKGSGAD